MESAVVGVPHGGADRDWRRGRYCPVRDDRHDRARHRFLYRGRPGFAVLVIRFSSIACGSLGIPLDGVPWIQLALHLAVLPVLFGALKRATGTLWLPSVVIVLCYANPEVAKYHAKILSESLFLTVVVLFIAAFLAFVTNPSRRNLLLASLWIAVGVTIKPVAWAFVVLLALAVLSRMLRERGGVALLAAFLVPLIAVVAAEQLSSRLIHGPKPGLARTAASVWQGGDGRCRYAGRRPHERPERRPAPRARS